MQAFDYYYQLKYQRFITLDILCPIQDNVVMCNVQGFSIVYLSVFMPTQASLQRAHYVFTVSVRCPSQCLSRANTGSPFEYRRVTRLMHVKALGRPDPLTAGWL